MWPIVLAFGTIAFFLALAGKARAEAGERVPTPRLAPPSLPPALPFRLPTAVIRVCPKEDKDFVTNVVKAMELGRATLDMMRKAHDIALRCSPEDALKIKDQLDKALISARAKAVAAATDSPLARIKAVLLASDAPPSPIPVKPGTDNPLWEIAKLKGIIVAKPKFEAVLLLFKKLQSLVGAKQDGRIGPKTVSKFRKKMLDRGFTVFPKTQASLAANAAKYSIVISQGVVPTQVGARGGSTANSPFPGR